MNFNDIPSALLALFFFLGVIVISPWFFLWKLGAIADELKKIRKLLEDDERNV